MRVRPSPPAPLNALWSCRVAPARDPRQLPFWPLGNHFKLAGVDSSVVAVERDKITLLQRSLPDPARARAEIDLQIRTRHQAHLAELSRYHRGVRRAAARSRENP